jgi:acyl carrier protein
MTDTNKTIERVRKIVAGLGPQDQPPGDDQPLFYEAAHTTSDVHRDNGGYGLDSLDRVEIVIAVEEEFHIDVADDVETEQFNTVASIARWLDSRKESPDGDVRNL